MCLCCFFFFKQKTAYEMRISDWSSDVCSSDLHVGLAVEVEVGLDGAGAQHHVEAQRPLLRHIGAHDGVAALGHHRHVLAPPQRIEAGPEEADRKSVV